MSKDAPHHNSEKHEGYLGDARTSEDTPKERSPEKIPFLSLMLTAFAAAFGVQSSKNRERDFSQTSIWPYIAAGVIFTVLFMGSLILIVSQVVE